MRLSQTSPRRSHWWRNFCITPHVYVKTNKQTIKPSREKTGAFRPELNTFFGFTLTYVSGLWVLFICVMQFEPILPRQELRFRLVLTRFSLCRLLQNHTRTTSFSRWRPLAMRAISCDDGLLFSTKLCSSASLAPRLQRQRHHEHGARAHSCTAPLQHRAVPDGRSPLPLPLVHAYFVVVQGCRRERKIRGCWRFPAGLQAAMTPQNEVTSHELNERPLILFNPLTLWLTLFLNFYTSSMLWITTWLLPY